MATVAALLLTRAALGFCIAGGAWPPPPLSRGFVASGTMSAAETTRVKILGVPPGHAYHNKSLLFLVHVAGGTVLHSDPAAVVWGARGLELVARMRAVVAHAAARNCTVPDATFGVNLHDAGGTYPAEKRTMSIATIGTGYDAAVPFTPSQHNPFWHAASERRLHSEPDTRAVAARVAHVHNWTSKQAIAYWRGKGTDGSRGDVRQQWRGGRGVRAKAVLLSMVHPKLLDARIVDGPPVQMRWSGGLAATITHLGAPADRVPFDTFFDHQVVVDLDGAGSSFRLPSLMLGNSAIVRPDRYQYWWSPAANGTFAACAPDLSDLMAQISALLRHPTKARRLVDAQARAVADGLFGLDHQLAAWLHILPYFPPQPDAGQYLTPA